MEKESSLKSKLSVRSVKPIPMYADRPESSTRTTKYLEESRTASTDGRDGSYSVLANTISFLRMVYREEKESGVRSPETCFVRAQLLGM